MPIMEPIQADVSIEENQNYYEKLNSLLEILNIQSEFCFNADESGFIDFVDIKKQSVIVPFNAPDGMVRGTSRSTKRASLTGTICMDESNFKPLIVVPNKRIEKKN